MRYGPQDHKWKGGKGKKFGESIGEKRGERRNKIDVAKKMLAKNMDINEITDITGLSETEIKEMSE